MSALKVSFMRDDIHRLYISNEHTYLITNSYQVPKHIGLKSLYCVRWRKILKSSPDLEIDQTMPNVELNIFKFQAPRLIIF